jgi:hypothetical protein
MCAASVSVPLQCANVFRDMPGSFRDVREGSWCRAEQHKLLRGTTRRS